MRGWHFLPANRRLGYGDGRLVTVGETLTVDCEPELCRAGLHAGYTILGTLEYAAGPILCEDKLGGVVVRGDDKASATERTVIRMADATAMLHEFACRCAEDALALVESPYPMAVEVVRVKRLWMVGQASDDELAKACATSPGRASVCSFEDARGAAAAAAYWAGSARAAWFASRTAGWFARDAAYAAAYAIHATYWAGAAAQASAGATQARRLAAMARTLEWEVVK